MIASKEGEKQPSGDEQSEKEKKKKKKKKKKRRKKKKEEHWEDKKTEMNPLEMLMKEQEREGEFWLFFVFLPLS